MDKPTFIKKIADRGDCSITTAKKFISVIEDVVMEAIALEDKVHFSFGTIGGKTKHARRVRLPKSGQWMEVPEKHGQPYYKPSKIAKD